MATETFQRPELKQRDPENKDLDKAALQAIAQACHQCRTLYHPPVHGFHVLNSGDAPDYQLRKRFLSGQAVAGQGSVSCSR